MTNTELVIPKGDYYCRTTAVIGELGGRPLRIRGEGPVDWVDAPGRGVALRWPVGHAEPAMIINAAGTELQHVRLQGNGPKQTTVPVVLQCNARVDLLHVYVFNWRAQTAAVELTGRDGGPGANMWSMRHVHVRGLWGPAKGFWVHGADANAGYAEQCDASDVQEGTSVHDDSFLGNLWAAPHVHAAETNTSPPYMADGRSSRTVFAGPYTEGYVSSTLAAPNMRIGGIGRMSGGGLQIAEGRISGATAINPTLRTTGFSRTGLQQLIRIEFEDGIDPKTGKPTTDFVVVQWDARTDDAGAPVNKNTYRTARALWRAASSKELARWLLK